MNALRPSQASLRPTAFSAVPQPSSATTTTPQGRQGRLGAISSSQAGNSSTAQHRPSPNSFAPLHPTSVAGAATVAVSAGQMPHHSQSPRRPSDVSSSTNTSSQPALPAFLARRPPPPPTHSKSVADPLPPPIPSPRTQHRDRHEDDDERSLQEAGEDDGLDDLPEVDDAVFEACLDLEEEEQTEEDLKAIAEELSLTSGLTHAEVLELLLEQQREKKAMRAAAAQAKKDKELLQALMGGGAKGRGGRGTRDADDDVTFLTSTPVVTEEGGEDAVKSSAAPAAANVSKPIPQPPAASQQHNPLQRRHDTRTMPLNADEEVDEDNDEGVETTAARMKRQLEELGFGGCGGTSPRVVAAGGSAVNDDNFVDLKTYRAQRAAKQHEMVSQHLASKRGVVPTPMALETRDVFVQAYELAQLKRQTAKADKEEEARKARELQDKERRMKGFFCNHAIQQKIADAAAKKREQQAALNQPSPIHAKSFVGSKQTV